MYWIGWLSYWACLGMVTYIKACYPNKKMSPRHEQNWLQPTISQHE
jgi:hypothetical protein